MFFTLLHVVAFKPFLKDLPIILKEVPIVLIFFLNEMLFFDNYTQTCITHTHWAIILLYMYLNIASFLNTFSVFSSVSAAPRLLHYS